MIKVLQYGEGNFLRAFAEHYFETLNRNGGNYEINIVKPTPHGNLDKFAAQNNRYHVVLRGVSDGEAKETVCEINAVKACFSPFTEYERYVAIAKDKDLKIIVSNTTEAGICYNENDRLMDFAGITYPAKLTKFLFERYRSGLGGVYVLPVELIDNNADELLSCVIRYAEKWDLGEGFIGWLKNENYFCNTLVDRIVSGYPKDESVKTHLTDLIGEKDELLTVCEPFGLWVIERKGEIDKYIKSGNHGVEIVLTDDIKFYKKRKVRILNGSHTNLVFAGIFGGKTTVYDCLTDEKLLRFFNDSLNNEILPFVSDDIKMTESYAKSVKDRFLNPFLNHLLESIALNSVSKWKARNLPSFSDYYEKTGTIPENLTKGFAFLATYYEKAERKDDGKFYVTVNGLTTEIKDDVRYLEYFAAGGGIKDFMADKTVWGEDLTQYKGFAEKVSFYVDMINAGKNIL